MNTLSAILALVSLAAMLLAGLVMSAEHLAEGIDLPFVPFGIVHDVHSLAAYSLMPLLGAWAGFSSARQTGGWGRIVGWNGLAVTLAIAVVFVALDAQVRAAAMDNLVSTLGGGTSFEEFKDARPIIASAIGLWAALMGVGVLLGGDPQTRAGGWIVQLLGGLAAAGYMLYALNPANFVGAEANLLIAALAILAVSSLHLTGAPHNGVPALWCGALVMLIGAFGFLDRGAYFSQRDTLVAATSAHLAVFALAPFLTLAILLAQRPAHLTLTWGAPLGLAVLLLLFGQAHFASGADGALRASPDFPGSLSASMREAATLGILAALWWILSLIAVLRRPRAARSAVYAC